MKKIIFLLTFFLMLYNSNSKAQNCLIADMMIIVDWSGSEQGHELEVATAAALFVDELPVDEDQLRIGIISFSNGVDDLYKITGDKKILMENLAYLSAIGASGGTLIEDALMVAGKELLNQRNVPKIILIISDGEIHDINDAVPTMYRLKTIMPLSVFAIQIGRDNIKGEIDYLIRLTGTPNNVEIAGPLEILEALKRLSICG